MEVGDMKFASCSYSVSGVNSYGLDVKFRCLTSYKFDAVRLLPVRLG